MAMFLVDFPSARSVKALSLKLAPEKPGGILENALLPAVYREDGVKFPLQNMGS